MQERNKKRWKTNVGSVYNLGFHIIWTTKYRRRVLVNGVDDMAKELIAKKCDEHKWELCSIEVMPDHIHLFVKPHPHDSVSYIVAQLKGSVSKVLREAYPHLKTKLPSLWTRSYYVESVGHISIDTILKYIDEQKTK